MAIRRKKGFTATRSKLTSRHLRTAMLGTHVPRRARASRMNGASVEFSSPRKQKKASRGYVDAILPSTTSRESSSQYARRVSRREFAQEVQRRVRVRRAVVLLVCLVLVIGVAGGVGIATFFGSLDSKLSLGDSNAASALATAKGSDVFYTVVAADLDPVGSTGSADGPDAIALVRTDRVAREVTIVSIPANLMTSLKDGKSHPLREVATLEGDASLVRAVADFAGVDVAHYVGIDAAGIVELVNSLGGIEIDVVEEVDDPTAGDVYIPSGVQSLDGVGTLTLLRASNFSSGSERKAENQRAVLTALALRLMGSSSTNFLTTLDAVGGSFGTDVSATDALALADELRGMSSASVKGTVVPGYEMTRDNVDYFVASSDEWTTLMGLVDAGEELVVAEVTPEVDPGSFTITVRNGSGVTGAAAQIAASLQERGFNVVETGNTDVTAYDETLVVYNNDAFQAAAQVVTSTLGTGRMVADVGYYTFGTDVLVILGKDWKPTA